MYPYGVLLCRAMTSLPTSAKPTRLRRPAVARLAATFAVVAGLLAMGGPSPASAQLGATRKISYLLTDNAYQPKVPLKLRKGDKITFTFVNKGKVVHEALVGTPAEQKAHEKEMATMGGMAMADEADLVVLKPGQSKTLTYTFKTAGTYEIGCHQPTHYKLGMKAPINVT